MILSELIDPYFFCNFYIHAKGEHEASHTHSTDFYVETVKFLALVLHLQNLFAPIFILI